MQHPGVMLHRDPRGKLPFCLLDVLLVKPFRSLPDKPFKLTEVLIYKDPNDFKRKIGYYNFCMCPVPENILLLENAVAFISPTACNAIQTEKYILFWELR